MNLCSIQLAISTSTERLRMASKIGGAAVVDSNFTRASYRVILRFNFYLLDCERLHLQILYRLTKSDNFTFANLKIVRLGPQLRNILACVHHEFMLNSLNIICVYTISFSVRPLKPPFSSSISKFCRFEVFNFNVFFILLFHCTWRYREQEN